MGKFILGVGLAAGLLLQSQTAKAETITLSKMAEQLPAGAIWFTHQDGLLCVTHETLKADGVLRQHSLNTYGPIFSRELNTVAGAAKSTRANLFEDKSSDEAVAYQVGALVHGLDVKVCTLAYGAYDGGAKGGAVIEIEWQIYSPARREVVASIETTGRAKAGRGTSREEVLAQLSTDAFADAVRQLAAAPKFRQLLSAPPPKDELQANPGQQSPIPVSARQAVARPVSQAVGSVVLIKLPGAIGSGFLISDDGYVLTDAHVVDANKAVTIRWSDGFEAPGQVVRLHKKRDVAIIKTDPHGRAPLPIRASPIEVGETVWAIGTPLDEAFQNSVTRGVVSAHRVLDGFAFIQSDVAINHGNSGGPLLDEKGYVVGLADLAFQLAYGVQSAQSYFTPIKDALDFLSLDVTSPPIPTPATPLEKASAPRTAGVSAR